MTIYHRHHVVPRHAGGTDDPSNMTCPLTVEEHAEHHRYRYEMLGEWQDRIAWQGLLGMISKQEAIHQIQTETNRGRKHSEETRRKQADANRGRKISEETRRKISEAKCGRKFSDEHRRKLSEAGRGRKVSEETRQKISESLRGRNCVSMSF